MSNLLPKYNFILETRPSLYKMGPKRGKHNDITILSYSEEQELGMDRVEKQGRRHVKRWVRMGSDDVLFI